MFNRISILILFLCTLPLCAFAGTVQLPQSGQTTCYNTAGAVVDCAGPGKGQDGNLRAGVSWPDPRFTVSGDCVTDNLTGLMWTKNGNMPGGGLTWQGALDYVATTVNSGAGTCGHTDWRLPNRKELRSLVDYSRYGHALPGGHPFTNVQAYVYWSSSTSAYYTHNAWVVGMEDGAVGNGMKSYDYFYVWPVRAGQSGSLGNLIINFSDTGDGTVSGNGVRNGNPVSFSTNTGSTEQFDIGTTVNLHGKPQPSGFSVFTGWTGYDTVNGSDCSLTMSASRNVTAFFDIYNAHKARIGDTENYYSTLQAAYNNAPNPGTVRAWGTDFSENLTCVKTKNATLEGGYNKGYTANNGYTTLKGNLSVDKGAVTVENIIITASDTVKHTYTIFGRISYNGTGLSGVAVALSGASAKNTTTDVRGHYKFPGLSNGTYTITPTRTGYTITPKQVTIKDANALMNFTAVKAGYSITGKITYNGTGLSGGR